jgi:hypothetical protein
MTAPVDLARVRRTLARLDRLVAAHPELCARECPVAALVAAEPVEQEPANDNATKVDA